MTTATQSRPKTGGRRPRKPEPVSNDEMLDREAVLPEVNRRCAGGRRMFLVTRLMPVGGSWAKPRTELRTFHVYAYSGADAAATASFHAYEARVEMWGAPSKKEFR